MKFETYSFRFRGGIITTRALSYTAAKILAQAEAIRRGWDFTVL